MILPPACPSCGSGDPKTAICKQRGSATFVTRRRKPGLTGAHTCADVWHDRWRLISPVWEGDELPPNHTELSAPTMMYLAGAITRLTVVDVFGSLDEAPLDRFIQYLFDDYSRVAVTSTTTRAESLKYVLAKELQRRSAKPGVRKIPTVLAQWECGMTNTAKVKLQDDQEVCIWDLTSIYLGNLQHFGKIAYATIYGKRSDWDPTEQQAESIIGSMEEAWESLSPTEA